MTSRVRANFMDTLQSRPLNRMLDASVTTGFCVIRRRRAEC
jgi:hypothetical protein